MSSVVICILGGKDIASPPVLFASTSFECIDYTLYNIYCKYPTGRNPSPKVERQDDRISFHKLIEWQDRIGAFMLRKVKRKSDKI